MTMTNHAAVLLTLLTVVTGPCPAAVRAEPAKSDALEAKAVLEQDVQAHPRNAELRVHLAFAYKKLGDADGAQQQFEQAAKLEPADGEVWYMLGLIYEKKGDKDRALAAWKSCASAAKEPGMKQTAEKHLHTLEATRR
jgi:Tfp pilus assembly protein PilF